MAIVRNRSQQIELPLAKPSELAQMLFRYKGQSMSFSDYLHSEIMLNLDAREILFLAGRQVAKSETLSTKILIRSTKPYNDALYIAPSIPQSKVFSTAKIQERINNSPEFKMMYIDNTCKRDVFERSTKANSRVYFRSASQMDNIRGIAIPDLYLDEYQDISSAAKSIILECTSGQKEVFLCKAGTPKTFQNHINTDFVDSNQLIPVLICPAGHHSIASVDMITPQGLRCPRKLSKDAKSKACNHELSVRPPNLYYKSAGKKGHHRVSIWIPQIVLPLHVENPIKWYELYKKKLEYDTDTFLNEIMGISSGSAMLMLSEKDMMRCCNNPSSFEMHDRFHENFPIHRLYAGIDWGITNSKSFTMLLIGGWNRETNKFQVIYGKKYIEPDPLKVLMHMAGTIKKFGVKYVVADWGAGHHANARLEEVLQQKVLRVFYTGDGRKIYWDETAGYYKASKTRTLIDTIMQIKARRIHFYEWRTFQELSPHFTAEYAEESLDSHGNVLIRFDHPPDKPDDAFQAFNIMFQVFKNAEDPFGRIFGRSS